MESGEWRVESGGVESGEWCDQRRVQSGDWRVQSGVWWSVVESGDWRVVSGEGSVQSQWTVYSGVEC